MNSQFLFLLVFGGIVFLLIMTLTVMPVVNGAGGSRRKLKDRLSSLSKMDSPEISRLVPDEKLRRLSPLERKIESSAIFESLRNLNVHAATHHSVLNVLAKCTIVSVFVAVLLNWFVSPEVALIGGGLGFFTPIFYLIHLKNKRLDRFEEQIPEALDLMKRSLMVGQPFVQTLKGISEEMEEPIANEFGLAFMDINYGASVESALNAMLERVPSVTLMALVTSVNVQKESGGNLVEILDNITGVVRGRFRFQRKLKTLSAEGRISAWVLSLIPFLLFIMLRIINPDYISKITDTPEGQTFLMYGLVGMTLGILWMKRIISKIEV